MSRDWRLYLDDLIACCNLILEFTTGLDKSDFLNIRRTYEAVLRQIELIGEAAKAIPNNVQERYPEIAWQEMIRTRNILAHVYFSVDDRIIWQIVTEEIPKLLDVLETIREEDR